MAKRHKSTIACDISPKVRSEVMERDYGCCIICGSPKGLQVAHYISRARMGMGIPQNLALLCHVCHWAYDQSYLHNGLKKIFADYLKERYEGWNEEDLVYRKGREL